MLYSLCTVNEAPLTVRLAVRSVDQRCSAGVIPAACLQFTASFNILSQLNILLLVFMAISLCPKLMNFSMQITHFCLTSSQKTRWRLLVSLCCGGQLVVSAPRVAYSTRGMNWQDPSNTFLHHIIFAFITLFDGLVSYIELKSTIQPIPAGTQKRASVEIKGKVPASDIRNY